MRCGERERAVRAIQLAELSSTVALPFTESCGERCEESAQQQPKCSSPRCTTHPRTINAEARRAFSPGRGFGSFWRINLEDQPFCLPPPLLAIGRDGEFQFGADKPETRIVGLWRLPLWPGWLYN